MTAKNKQHGMNVRDTIPGSVTIRRRGRNEWYVKQRYYGDEHDNNQNPTWVRIENPGRATKIVVHLTWAQFRHMQHRTIGYQQIGGKYRIVRGRTEPTKTVFEVEIPRGQSFFGAFPWYSNEDVDRFMRRMGRRPNGRVRSIGKTGKGRDIQCLTIDTDSGKRAKRNVVVMGRMHATEPSGSFAVEGTARFLLGKKAPAKWLKECAFHLIPVVNPDGTADGLKLTRMGPVEEYDMVRGGTGSNDPTIKALRDELNALRPACLISHHSYLPSSPFLGVFEKSVGLNMLDELIKDWREGDDTWLIRVTSAEPKFLRYHCYKEFGTTAVFTEMPWQGRLPKDIEKLGADIFRAMMMAHEKRARRLT